VIKHYLLTILRGLLLSQFIWLLTPYLVGVWYDHCGQREAEQEWLDEAIDHCKRMRAHCHDPDLRGILDYTITRYNRIGGFDVSVLPCFSPSRNIRVIGINMPCCPGVCLDPVVLSYDIKDGAMVLIHEAMHDYFPYWGHSHIHQRERKLYAISYAVRR